MSHTKRDGAADDTSPWTRPGFIAAAVVVAIIVVLGLIIALSGDSQDDSAARPAAPPARQPSAKADDDASICGLEPGSQTVPDSAPDSTWELVGKMIAPTAPASYGPGRVASGFRTCFQHSPMGALYAAVSFWATLTAKTDAETYQRLAVSSPARDRAITAAKGQRTPQLAGFQVAGFTFSAYADDRAVVRLAFRVEDGRFVSADTPLAWTDGDWRYDVPLDQGRGSVAPVADLSGFVAWKGS